MFIVNRYKILLTNGCGWGVFADEDIAVGTFICEYTGELLSDDETRERLQQKSQDGVNYILVIQEFFPTSTKTESERENKRRKVEKVINVSNTKKITGIDATISGNVGRFINHSCDPNAVVIPIRTNSRVPRAGIFATREIKAKEEIFISYGEVSSSVGDKKLQCHCNSAKCKGVLPYESNI